MSGHQDSQKHGRGSKPAEADQILDLNFVPQWARRPPDQVHVERFKDADTGRGSRDRPRGHGGGRRDRDRRDMDRRPRRPRPQDDSRRPARRPRHDAGGGAPPREEYPRREREEPWRQAQSQGRRDYAPATPLNVRFLPEQKALASVAKKVSATKRAYPLLDLASLLMSKPGCCYVKLEMGHEDREKQLYQCKLCRTVATQQGDIESHVLRDHQDQYFDMEEKEGELPSGTFVCIAKCGLSGELLGPPNHHSYPEAVKRMHTTRFGHMSIDAYRDRIELSHSAEDVEAWKAQAAKTVVYKLKGKEGDEAQSMAQGDAERYLRENVLPKVVVRTRRAVVSESVAHEIRDAEIKRAIRQEWQRESHFPLKVSFALRAALKHRHLYVFKAGSGKGVNFVTAVDPTPLDPDTAIPEIHDVLTHLRAHPGCTREEMVAALRPDADPDSEEVRALLQPLHWLIDRGHIIEFFNGTLSVPLGRRG